MGLILSMFDATYALAKSSTAPFATEQPAHFMAAGLLGAAAVNFCFGFSSVTVLFGAGGF